MNVRYMMPDALRSEVDVEDETTRAAEMTEDEFRGFYERTARPLWAYLSRITGNPQLADDLLQEAYYRFYRADATYENESHRRNSLYRIATNLAHDAGRRQKHRRHLALDDASSPEVADAKSDPAEGVQRRTDLARAMSKLTAVQREMLWLAYAQGASHEEIADVLEVRPGSVRTLLYRARRKLAKLLGDANASGRVTR